ncbi:MAG: hypothetical protein K1W30_10845 [Lachnospiraceae bacterium]
MKIQANPIHTLAELFFAIHVRIENRRRRDGTERKEIVCWWLRWLPGMGGKRKKKVKELYEI